jgi:hypothetical protein
MYAPVFSVNIREETTEHTLTNSKRNSVNSTADVRSKVPDILCFLD